jgi:hypothetical protein
LKLLLCDAVIVIEAHKHKLWNSLKAHFKIHIASTVLKELQFFRDDLHQRHYLNLRSDIDGGRINVISITPVDIRAILKTAHDHKRDIQVGEAESLAALLQPKYKTLLFCTADKAAIVVAHLYDVMSRVVPLEECISGKKACRLPYKLSKKAMTYWKAQAIQIVKQEK